MPNLFGLNGPPRLSEWQRQAIGSAGIPGAVYNAGRLANWIYNQILNGRSTPDTGGPNQSQAPTTAGFGPGQDPTDPNNPNNYRVGDAPPRTYQPMTPPGFDAASIYNANRQPFGMTWQQAQMPGSAIGPISTG